MNKNGPVIVIEDDIDDQEILTEVFQDTFFGQYGYDDLLSIVV